MQRSISQAVIRPISRLTQIILVALVMFESAFARSGREPLSKQSAATAASSATSASSSPPSTPPIVDSDLPAEYRIGFNDVLRVAVWKEPELSATVAVRTDGMISVPLVDDIQAEGLTPMQLAGALRERLKKYVEDPRVTVVVSQMTPQRIYIVGEVSRRGPMSLLPEMTVFQALASAGLTQFANAKKIYVLRTVNDKQRKLFVNYKKLIKGQQMDQNIKLESGDTIVVP